MPSKLIFVVLNFVTATSPGVWHSDDVHISLTIFFVTCTYRDLDKINNIHEIEEYLVLKTLSAG